VKLTVTVCSHRALPLTRTEKFRLAWLGAVGAARDGPTYARCTILSTWMSAEGAIRPPRIGGAGRWEALIERSPERGRVR
jgi:hypothetical protein